MMYSKTKNLDDSIRYPLIVLVMEFQKALQIENFEMCEKIKFEMDRRAHMNKINKKALKQILDCMGTFSIKRDSQDEEYYNQMFSAYL